jgi:FkbM family methyltransferase
MIAQSGRPTFRDRVLTWYARRRWRGFFTLGRLLGRDTVAVRTRYGAVVTLHPRDYIDRLVLLEGYYESEVFEALRPFFAPDAVLWDIGANFGLHSVSAARAEPAMQVHSFEPSPTILARLQAHADVNQTPITIWKLALGDRDGTANLYINASGNPGMTTLTPWSEGRYDSKQTIPVARADTLINTGKLPAPTLIKLDVEGAEAAVLAGFGDLLHRRELRAVVFEAQCDLLSAATPCPAADLLRTAGFGIIALKRHENSAHLLGNFLATRPVT